MTTITTTIIHHHQMSRPEFQSESFKRGVQVRREVLGDEYVDKSLNNATDLTAGMQQVATELAWDAIWTRPGLARRDRSLIVCAMLAATAKSSELKVHIRGAIRNGLTLQEYVLFGDGLKDWRT
jgi:4-carboxymuconolactone decarboxylase